jgi:hypothetical protein
MPSILGIGPVKQRRIGRDSEAALKRLPNAVDGDFVSPFAADGEIVVLFLSIQVHAERQVLARLEEMNFLLQQQGVGAKIDVFLARNQPCDNLVDLRMHQRFAAGNGNHGRAALIDCLETFLRAEILLEDVSRILNFAAARAREVAAE